MRNKGPFFSPAKSYVNVFLVCVFLRMLFVGAKIMLFGVRSCLLYTCHESNDGSGRRYKAQVWNCGRLPAAVGGVIADSARNTMRAPACSAWPVLSGDGLVAVIRGRRTTPTAGALLEALRWRIAGECMSMAAMRAFVFRMCVDTIRQAFVSTESAVVPSFAGNTTPRDIWVVALQTVAWAQDAVAGYPCALGCGRRRATRHFPIGAARVARVVEAGMFWWVWSPIARATGCGMLGWNCAAPPPAGG